MILGIAFLGEERRPLRSALRVWIAHMFGGVFGGAIMAVVIWMLLTPFRTMIAPEIITLIVALFLVVAAWLQLTGRRLWRSGLVPNTWPSRFGEPHGWALLGFVLGTGLGSYVVTTLTYATFITAGLLLGLGQAAVAGGLLGFGRTFVVGLASAIPTRIGKWLFLSGKGPRWTTAITAAGAVATSAAFLIGGVK